MTIWTVGHDTATEDTVQIQTAIEGFLMDCRQRGRSSETQRLYRSHLMILATWLGEQGVVELQEVTIVHLRSFMDATMNRTAGSLNPRRPAAADGHSPTQATLRSYVKAMKVFFRWAVDEEYMDKDPAHRLHKPQLSQRIVPTLRKEELEALLGACDLSTALGFRDYVLMWLLLDTGIRVSELCALTLDTIHDDHIKVRGKGDKEREVGISPPTCKLLWKYIHWHRETADDAVAAVFTGFAGNPLQPSGVEKMLKRVQHAAGLDDVSLSAHKFRHTFARAWLERGGEVMSLSRLMGHSSVKITEIYLGDFQSRQARMQQAKYSPVNDLRPPKTGHGQHRYRRKRHPPRDGDATPESGRA